MTLEQPTYALPLFTGDTVATKASHDAEINRVVGILYDNDQYLSTRIDGVAVAGVLVGDWDAASGAFPTLRPDGEPIKRGDIWRVIGAGTVDGEAFVVGDYLQSVQDGGGVTFEGNWVRAAIGQIAEYADRAEQAAIAAEIAASENYGAFASRAEAQATNIPVAQQRIFVHHNGLLLAYDRATAGTALVSGDGAIWMPSATLPSYMQHWGVNTYNSEAAALAAGAAMTSGQRLAQQAALVAAFGETSGELVVKGFVEAFDQITINPGRRVRLFSGPDFNGVCISARFNMAASCIVQGGTTAGGGCVVESLGILCDQSPAMASGLRADLIQYPSAFDCAGDFGQLDFLRVQRAYTAFRAVREDAANNGGWRVGRIEYSSFADGVKIGTATKGPLHFFAIADLDAWPHGFAGNANLLAIYYDGTGRQAYFGRCDNLTVDRMGIFRGGRVEIDAANGLPVQIDKLALDGDGAELRLISGKSIIGSIYGTEAATAPQLDFKIKCSGGSHRINACDIVGDATPFIEVTGGELMASGRFYNTNLTVGQIATVTAGELSLIDSRLVWPNGSRIVPAIEQSGTGVLRLVNCTVDPTITTVGVAVKFNTDQPGNLVNPDDYGRHSVTIPSGALAGVYGRQQHLRCTVGGTSSAITLTTGANLSGTLPTGIELRFRATAPNPGATTVSVDGGPPIACRTVTAVALPGGYIRTDVDTVATYDGTYWVLERRVQRGSGWTRWEDGTQQCLARVLIKPAADATTGIKSVTWTFPIAFGAGLSADTAVNHTVQSTNPIQRGQVSVGACTNTDVALYYNEGAGSASDITTHATATGRWF